MAPHSCRRGNADRGETPAARKRAREIRGRVTNRLGLAFAETRGAASARRDLQSDWDGVRAALLSSLQGAPGLFQYGGNELPAGFRSAPSAFERRRGLDCQEAPRRVHDE